MLIQGPHLGLTPLHSRSDAPTRLTVNAALTAH